MAKKKLQRFAELQTFPNVFQQQRGLKGNWHRDYFHNDNPIILELACGKGEYTVAMAQRFPNKNYVGVDIKGARLWRGAKESLSLKLSNVAFIRIPIETISEWFAPGEVDEIWITFPDPFPREGKARKRLTSPRFLDLYEKILKQGGIIHLKTDEANLFRFTQEVIHARPGKILRIIEDLYKEHISDELLSIQTTYEKKHLADNRTIRYVCFSI